jgi:tRNA1Val (adenine37-N6)-methyltransferase
MRTTDGHLLNGRVRYAQPAEGFRSGIEPVLLAAAVPARAGERVLELGAGAGAALLCLSARVPGIQGLGIERDDALAALATRNAAANDWPEVRFAAADVADPGEAGSFDHAFTNPPYHPDDGTASPDRGRDTARRAASGLFGVWASAMGRCLRHRGSATWIVTAAVAPICMTALQSAGCHPVGVLPLWPRVGVAAKLVLLHAIKDGRGPFRVLPGLVLHDAAGGFTPEADAILRDGDALHW